MSYKWKIEIGNVALLYAAKNEKINHVIVLKGWIEDNLANLAYWH